MPSGTIEVPVYINDNGREYNTIFYAGPMQAAMTEDGTIFPSLDWALVGIIIFLFSNCNYHLLYRSIKYYIISYRS